MKAFEVTIPNYFEVVCIYADETASKARYQAYKGMSSANYDNIKFGDINVIRAPEFDKDAENSWKACQLGWKERPSSITGYGIFDHNSEL